MGTMQGLCRAVAEQQAMRYRPTKDKLRRLAQMRAAKERKRLTQGRSELDEEIRWMRGDELTKTK